jgi:Fe-S-cluster-containing dehydrogenase component/Ni/Fe-hydrogenase subunit HybB-like protein
VRYGFAIDQRTCIGCHACTVACKTEHEVPVGQFRTWVKYVDKGQFPDSTRAFSVMRCNHCTDAPCVKICPTKALFVRDDGIVDFDNSRCIGCKSCMQACPYDAIYIDEQTHTAAKCNFCAHRVDEGLEPACVVVCPTHSIWVGDLEDPNSGISRLINNNPTAVRAPEQNTGPNVFYLGADQATLDPLGAPVDKSYIFSRPDEHRAEVDRDRSPNPITQARTTLNTAHDRPWGWRVTTYLWTKSVSAGALLIAAIAWLLSIPLGVVGSVVAPAIALVFTAATGVLLVWDLKQPKRFLFIFTKPNFRSWLVLGAIALSIYSAVAAAWLVIGALRETSAISSGAFDTAMTVLSAIAIPAAAATAGYTGFLFGQAEGRDLWQSPLLFWHLLVQAAMVGGGALVVALPFVDLPATGDSYLIHVLVVATIAHLVVVLLELGGRHATRGAAVAAHMITRGRYASLFWTAGIGLAAVAIGIGAFSWQAAAAGPAVAAAVLVQAAILAYESCFVRAGQDVPLS